MAAIETRIATDPAELEAFAPIVAWAFGGNTSASLQWLKNAAAGAGAVRVAAAGGVVRGGLVEIPMAQWFGGRSVPMLGLAGVAVAPEARARGLALRLVADTLRAARQRGSALSTLYPSTFGLYRKAGYELAGSYGNITLQLRQLPRMPRPLQVVSSIDPAPAEVETLYRKLAQNRPGYLDRGAYIWNRVRKFEQEPARAFLVHGPSGLDGYMYARAAAPRNVPIELVLNDFMTRTPQAFQSLLAFLADHSTTAERAVWHGSASDARILGLPERVAQVTVQDYWMLRLLHVERALLLRGYPEIDLAIDLQVEDDFLPENSGVYGLCVRSGVARLEPGIPQLSARLSVGALAALYSGFMAPRELQIAGKLEADERALSALAVLFAGPAPALADFF
jgi:predicted acetyltransferase